jgi:hypothetical protein
MHHVIKGNVRRRTLLRGMLGGAAVTVGLPFLDCFLNDHGTALASGRPMPPRFGTWFWGLGFQPGFGISGPEMTLGEEARALERHRSRMNYFGGFNAQLDDRANLNHWSGAIVTRTGAAPATSDDFPAPTLDVLIGDAFSDGTRFGRLDLSAAGPIGYSARSTASPNTPEASAVAMYTRLFGADFINPNSSDFRPDPKTMVMKSVLSAVNDHSKGFIKTLGAADKARMDAYFTSIREVEQQLALQMQKPAPNKACYVPDAPPEEQVSESGRRSFDMDINMVEARHKALTDLLVMGLACNQARVFTMTFSSAVSGLRKQGSPDIHHTISHEEPIDPKFGYQPTVHWFNLRVTEQMARFVDAFAQVPEGAGTLLDNTLIFAHSDTNDARTHQLNAIPIITFGSGGGRFKTGQSIQGNGDPSTRVGLTVMKGLGLPMEKWGFKSNETSRPVHEIIA